MHVFCIAVGERGVQNGRFNRDHGSIIRDGRLRRVGVRVVLRVAWAGEMMRMGRPGIGSLTE